MQMSGRRLGRLLVGTAVPPDPTPVPEPMTVALIVPGLLAIGVAARTRRRA